MSAAFIFPCQGSQHPGMLRRLPESSVKNHFLDLASEFIGYDVHRLESENALATTEATQIALFVAGVIGAQTLRKGGIQPSFVAGHSVGAFAAAVVSGSLPFEVGLQLVAYRASLLHSAFPTGYGMGWIAGLEESTVSQLLSEIPGGRRRVYVASVNTRNQVFLAGLNDQVDSVLWSARKHSARKAERLRIAVPLHCCLLRNVARKLRRSFRSIRPANPQIPFVSSRSGKILRTGEAICKDLIEYIEHPLRWCDAVKTMVDAQVSLFIEMPPGRMLTDFGSTSFPDVQYLAFDNANVGEHCRLSEQGHQRFVNTIRGPIKSANFNGGLCAGTLS